MPFNINNRYTKFSDVNEDSWYAPYVQAAVRAQIIKGYEDGTFQPKKEVNRVEALKMLIEAAGYESIAGQHNFKDVKIKSWYYSYVGFAFNKGIVKGKTATEFAPKKSVTRAGIAKMLSKVMDLKE